MTAGVALALHAYVRTMLHSAREVQVETARDAHRDPLTGVANRAGFLDHVSALERDAARRGEPLWSAFLDVDRRRARNFLCDGRATMRNDP